MKLKNKKGKDMKVENIRVRNFPIVVKCREYFDYWLDQEEKKSADLDYFILFVCICGRELKIKEKKDFPNENTKCECGRYFVRYEE